VQPAWNGTVKDEAVRFEVDFKGAAPEKIRPKQSVDSPSCRLPMKGRSGNRDVGRAKIADGYIGRTAIFHRVVSAEARGSPS
jgi:hypothetical protein